LDVKVVFVTDFAGSVYSANLDISTAQTRRLCSPRREIYPALLT